MTSSMMPGTVLAGRYRLEDLLDDVDGARFWRATDTVLARSVAVHAIDESDSRVAGMLEAARISATVTDPHLLRVLDADVREGKAWVINEWGTGQSLDEMVSRGVLPPDRAAWLVREAATAIAAAHSFDIAHGRLAPENVMVTESGTVRLIGFAVDAALQRDRLRSGNYPEADDRQADIFDLAGLLYAGLVGCWPGASGSMVKPAPRDAHGPLRPRQVRAGVPRPLDAICDRLLARSVPNRTAHQLAAVLTEYIGELATADPASVPTTSAARLGADSSLSDLEGAVGSDAASPGTGTAPQPAVSDDTSEEAAPEPEPTTVLGAGALAGEYVADDIPWQPEPESPTAGVHAPPPEPDDAADHEPSGADLEETAVADLAVLGFEDAPSPGGPPAGPDDHQEWHQPRSAPASPAPSLEPLPERPLFAPEGTRRTPKWSVPRSETSGWGTNEGLLTGTGTGSVHGEPDWPFGSDPEEEPDDWEERTSRHWLRLPLVIAVLAVLAIAAAFVFTIGGKDATRTPGTTSSGSPSASTTARGGQPIRIAAVKDLDPFGDPPEEHPAEAKNATDGNPDTTWQTLTYRGRPNLGGLKPGVGLMIDLGSIQNVGSVAVDLVGTPTDLVLYASPTSAGAPTGVEGLTRIASKDRAGEQVVLKTATPVRARYLVVWLTSLPPAAGGFRGEISEIAVRS